MKKLIYIFITILSLITIFTFHNKKDVELINNITSIEKQIAFPFNIPDYIELSNPNDIYPILSELTNELKINIFREVIKSNKDGNFEIKKYILLGNETKFYDVFNIEGEQILPNDGDVDKFISTTSDKELNQIGIIKDFSNNDIISINSLKQLYKHSPVKGIYYVELPNNLNLDEFLEVFISKINLKLNTNYKIDDFKSIVDYETGIKDINSYLILIKYFLLITTIILIIYNLLNNLKTISIYKLHGISYLKLWFIIVQKPVIFLFLFLTLIIEIIFLFLKYDIHFILGIFIYQIINYLIISIVTFFIFAYIFNTNINIGLKNKKSISIIFIINNLMKIVFTISIIFLSSMMISNLGEIKDSLSNLKSWEKSSEYGIFYPINIGNDRDVFSTNPNEFFTVINQELYPILNKNGSILMEAKDYEEYSLQFDLQYKENGVIKSAKINPNYLKEFPIYDNNNNSINISENEINTILLVPEKYKDNEVQILSYFKESRQENYEYDEQELLKVVPEEIKNQKIKIIWTKNNQKIFSFNPEVFKSKNNFIIDPIIQVITLNNSVLSDRNTILGGGGTDPLKIKLKDKSTETTYKELLPTLKKLGLDDNLNYLVSVDDVMLSIIYELRSNLYMLLIIITILIGSFFIVTIQNISILFNKNKKNFIIKRIFGFSFIKTYKEFIFLFSIIWFIQICSTLIINNLIIHYVNKNLIILLVLFIFIEFIFSILAIIIIENKSKLNIIKGE